MTLFPSPQLLFVYYKEAAIGYSASRAIDNRVAPITIFGNFRYPDYSSARMGKQMIAYRISKLITLISKGGGA